MYAASLIVHATNRTNLTINLCNSTSNISSNYSMAAGMIGLIENYSLIFVNNSQFLGNINTSQSNNFENGIQATYNNLNVPRIQVF